MINACTIIARNYLPFARVLADSFFAHHPDGSFTVLLIDDENRTLTLDPGPVDWRRLDDIGLDNREIHRLAGIYDVTELATAVKPVLLRSLLDEDRDHIIYLDPDIRIYAPLEDLGPLARRHGIVLTPHTTEPYPKDQRRIDGFFILAAGVYNLGFIAVSRDARSFLDWWWQLTRRDALVDVAKMMFTDQRWIDFAPCFFEPFLLKDPGYNVAYWNLHARDVSAGNSYFVNGTSPLRFFHFSGFDIGKPWLLSRHQGDNPRVLLSERPVLAEICEGYAMSLREAGAGTDGIPYSWSRLPWGIPVTARIRRLYRTALLQSEQTEVAEPPDPFDATDPGAFVNWLNAPEEGGPRGVSRYLYAIYKDRPDLQFHFPLIFGSDAVPFNEWIWGDGVTQENIPLQLLPIAGPEASETPCAPLRPGLNLAGYFKAELGIGEAARLLTMAVDAAGIPHSTTTYQATLSRQHHRFAQNSLDTGYDVNVLCVNADSTPRFVGDVGQNFLAERHNVGYWFWEIDRFPATMHKAFDFVDEVWTATDFVADAIRAVDRKPVFTVPLPLAVPRSISSITRHQLGVPERFTFLLMFDFLSIVNRKNPFGVISAFREAFAIDEGPVLILKSINGNRRLTMLEQLRVEVADRPDILIIDGYCSSEERHAFMAFCDCYVSLHRSEGLGLTLAEAMSLAKPTIATGYSGNLHFMNADNSYLVDYVMSDVPAGCDPYPVGAQWADPDIGKAADFMRRVYEQPAEAARVGLRGQADMFTYHSVDVSAAAVSQRVEQIRHSKRHRIAATPLQPAAADAAPQPQDDRSADTGDRVETIAAADLRSSEPQSAEPLDVTLQRLDELATPRLSAEGRRFPGVRLALQRTMFRVTRPYWFQQRKFHTELIGTLGRLLTAIREEGQRARADLDRLRIAQEHRAGDLDATTTRLEGRLQAETNRLDGALDVEVRKLTQRMVVTLRELAKSNNELRALLEHRNGTREGEVLTGRQRDRLEASLKTLQGSSETFQTNAAAHLKGLTEALTETQVQLSTLTQRLFPVPYMADPGKFLEKDERGAVRLGYRSTSAGEKAFYPGFEEIFRGPETLVRERQRIYLPLFRGRDGVVDIGCGRGEMLDLLRESGTYAMGIDSDPDMVGHCRAKGHTVEQSHALDFLRHQADGSVPAVFSAQMIEHLTFDELKQFLSLCRAKLPSGGILIMETVNPHSLEAFKTFYTDLTHQRPIFPEVALALCELSGFEKAHVTFPLGGDDLDANRRSQGEYAVVATACNT